MFTSKLPALISVASLSLILSACGGGKSEEGSTLDNYDDSQAVLDNYDNDRSTLDNYDDDQSTLDNYNSDQSILDLYDDGLSILDGYDDSTSTLDGYLDGIPNSGGSGGGNGGGGNNNWTPADLDYLDCTALNPDKIYLAGYLSSNGENIAIMDLEDPTRFCIGLPANWKAYAIAETGRLVYSSPNGIMRMQPDILYNISLGNDTLWGYPQDTEANDDRISTVSASTIGVSNFKLNSDVNNFYYTITDNDSTNDGIYLNGSRYFETTNSNFKFLGVMPSGEILLSEENPVDPFSQELFIIDNDLNKIPLAHPLAGAVNFYPTSRVFIDPLTNNESAWIIAVIDDVASRWSIDLTNRTVTNEGNFTAIPNPIDHQSGISSGVAKIDGNGNMIEIALHFSSSASYRVVFKRPIESSGEATTILHSDNDYLGGNWQTDSALFVHIVYGFGLVTGQ